MAVKIVVDVLRDEALRKASDLAGSLIERAANGINGVIGKVVGVENERNSA